jgi:hypothetical protein
MLQTLREIVFINLENYDFSYYTFSIIFSSFHKCPLYMSTWYLYISDYINFLDSVFQCSLYKYNGHMEADQYTPIYTSLNTIHRVDIIQVHYPPNFNVPTT